MGPMNWTSGSTRKLIILRPPMRPRPWHGLANPGRVGRLLIRVALAVALGLVFLAQLAVIVPNTGGKMERIWSVGEYGRPSSTPVTNDTLRYAVSVIDIYCISSHTVCSDKIDPSFENDFTLLTEN